MVKNGFGHPHHLTPKAPLFLREEGGGGLKGGTGNFRKLWGISLSLFLLLLKIKMEKIDKKNKKNKRK